jgi:uncharacterized SAM-binding protein YcdF (DUF218 family)
MFFYASKIFWTLAQPISLVMLLGLTGIVLALLGRRRLALAAHTAGAALLFAASFTTLGPLLIQPLENRFAKVAAPAEISAIIVLGGSTSSRIGGARGVTELNAAGDRLTEAVRLARLYPDAPLIFTGGIGAILAEGETEAASAGRFFDDLGVDADRLVLEDQARNTSENAELTAGLIEDRSRPALLVTSAFHMPRSVGLFRKQGVDVVPWPVDYRSTGTEGPGLDIANPVMSLETTGIAMREWIGLLAYGWTGQTTELFPGP